MMVIVARTKGGDWDPGKVRRLQDHAAWQFLSRFLRPGIRVRVQESSGRELATLNQYAASNPQVRGAAIFFHFDNLNSDIRSNQISIISLAARLAEGVGSNSGDYGFAKK